MESQELKQHIKDFLIEHKQGSLATTINNIPRSSPVQYFTDDNMNLYIVSAGGEKFNAIKDNPNVCLLVNSDYIDYKKIKGVQVFGKASTSLDNEDILEEARRYSPEPYIIDNNKTSLNAIKIQPEEIVYLDSLRDGDRTKQILKNNTVTMKADGNIGIH